MLFSKSSISLPLSLSFYLLISLSCCLTCALESQTNAINANQWPVIRAKAHSDVTVWLSRTLCQELRVCCNVPLVAVTHDGFNVKKKKRKSSFSIFLKCSRLKQSYMQTLQNTFRQYWQILNAYFVLLLILMLIHHTCLFNQLSDSLSVFLSLLAMHLG